MLHRDIVIKAVNGLHTRPAAQFVQAAKKFSSNITITNQGKTTNAKSLFKLQTLELVHNSIIRLSAEGIDEKEAIEYLSNLMTKLK
ncbi:phosphocarrier protein Hpr [Buchnera aphidicola (Nipponaphis monzeni)]|uniref:Phosphocarrier protein HPr n=1 Tax=Buchnera aphidicola (Nipponaphis monzeni) TaxID=2495405 RepID=A0A455T9T2_9GAMM|nr:HPr family phosphocarrier protein [Buchnera aphidicola]BBI01070.1 phosphocarrier protein Hpr [Buchnera aphidicola (Nipponaphis monzeni)]